MRVYLPATLLTLRRLLEEREVTPDPRQPVVYAVTPALREGHAEADVDELEYEAMAEAARASVLLLSVDPSVPRRRVVLAADVPDAAVTWVPKEGAAAVRVAAPVPLALVAAVHIDDGEAEADVRAAVEGLTRGADSRDGSPVADVEDHELLWFATQEIPVLLSS